MAQELGADLELLVSFLLTLLAKQIVQFSVELRFGLLRVLTHLTQLIENSLTVFALLFESISDSITGFRIVERFWPILFQIGQLLLERLLLVGQFSRRATSVAHLIGKFAGRFFSEVIAQLLELFSRSGTGRQRL